MSNPTILPATPSPVPSPSSSPSPAPHPSGSGPASGSSEPAAHVLAAPFPEPVASSPDPAGSGAGASAGGQPGPSARLTRQQFRDGFAGLFNVGSTATGLKSLRIDADRKPQADAAADALYDTAQEVSWLAWLIEPGNVWVQRAFVVGAFGFGMGQGVRAELAERRRQAKPAAPVARSNPDNPSQPAPDRSAAGAHADMAPLGLVPGQEEAA